MKKFQETPRRRHFQGHFGALGRSLFSKLNGFATEKSLIRFCSSPDPFKLIHATVCCVRDGQYQIARLITGFKKEQQHLSL